MNVMNVASTVKPYTRVAVDENGDSVFEDAELALTQQHVAQALPPLGVAGIASTEGSLYLLSPEFAADPHPAPRVQWIVMLRGVLEIEVTSGATRRFEPGDLVLVADTVGRGHRTRSIGDPIEGLFVPVDEAVLLG